VAQAWTVARHSVEPMLLTHLEAILVVGGETELDPTGSREDLVKGFLRLAELRGRVIGGAPRQTVPGGAQVVADSGVDLSLRATRRPVHRSRGVEDDEDVGLTRGSAKEVAVVSDRWTCRRTDRH